MLVLVVVPALNQKTLKTGRADSAKMIRVSPTSSTLAAVTTAGSVRPIKVPAKAKPNLSWSASLALNPPLGVEVPTLSLPPRSHLEKRGMAKAKSAQEEKAIETPQEMETIVIVATW